MNFLDGHLFPENQQPLVITAAPYAPSYVPSDFPEDIPVTMEAQIQKAVARSPSHQRAMALPPSGFPTIRATCWPISIPSPTRSR
ncbi:hypothetical protein OR16_00145 [Cupriavidus basilensis OR16]|uniref:Uncharacterized protein n=1 Tax=Cupriavidus basilensis OR16 TaxID=1127483 RepID=H1RXZ1_9BURK|nr:hypothetical protein OR16_00145 [Cupriavidus basilensis OR16]